MAVLLSLDVDNQTPALAAAQDAHATSIGTLSRGEYGARVGLQSQPEPLAQTPNRFAVQGRFQAAAVTLDLRDDANFSRPCSSRTFPGIVGDDPPDEQSIASTLKRNAAEDFSGIYRDLLELLDARTDSGNRSLGIVH